MQITCFQCRQQLDVPEESAGKRIRCPHCSYVIVAPPKPKAVGESHEPAIGLPSMDLDDGVTPAPQPKPAASKIPATPIPSTPIPATPLPPMPLPTSTPEKPKAKKLDPDEDLPAPSIERGARRRTPTGPAPAQKSGTVKALVILGFIGALGVGVVIGAVAVSESRRNQPQPMPPMAFKQMPPQFFNPGMPMPMPAPQPFIPGDG